MTTDHVLLQLNERPVTILLKGHAEFLLGINNDRAIPGDGFTDRLASEE